MEVSPTALPCASMVGKQKEQDMVEKGKIKKLLSCNIECRGMTLVALVGGIVAVARLLR